MICLGNLKRISNALWHCHEATHTQGLQYDDACDFQEMAAAVDNEVMSIEETNETTYEVGDVITLQTADGQIVFKVMPNRGIHVMKRSPLAEDKKTNEKAKDGRLINDYGCFYCLIDQASRGHIRIVKDLFTSDGMYTQDYLDAALHAAVENGHFSVESFLISKGAKYKTGNECCPGNTIQMFKVYCQDCKKHLASETNSIVCRGCGEYRTGDYAAYKAKTMQLERHLAL